MLRRAHVNGASLQVRGFARAQGLLDFRRVLLTAMRHLLRSGPLGQVRLDDVTPGQTAGGMLASVARRRSLPEERSTSNSDALNSQLPVTT